jgi:nucleotide-binding universal stress UspA family protein
VVEWQRVLFPCTEMTAASNAIVVGVDGSPESKAALEWAVDEARLRGTDVLALYAWAYAPVTEALAPAPLPYSGDFLRKDAEEMLDAAVAEAGSEDVRVRQIVVEGDAADALVEASEHAQLLVVGSRGLGGVASILLGSVSKRCAHEAACPVVIFRRPRPEHDKEAP